MNIKKLFNNILSILLIVMLILILDGAFPRKYTGLLLVTLVLIKMMFAYKYNKGFIHNVYKVTYDELKK